jgi:N-acetylmuramoyl-L-alanine amidase
MVCYLTRRTDTDVSLEARREIARRHQGDVFISLHCNGVPKQSLNGVQGVELFYLNTKGKSTESSLSALEAIENNENAAGPGENGNGMLEKVLRGLAEDSWDAVCSDSNRLCDSINKRFRANAYAGFRRHNRGIKRAFFQVLRLPMPSLLLEIGFLSNAEEARTMARPDFQTMVAGLVFEGLNDYLAQEDPEFRPYQVALGR